MQVIPRYCSQCNRKIPPRNLKSGRAIAHKEYFFCSRCIQKHPPLQKLKEAIEKKEEKKKKQSARRKEKTRAKAESQEGEKRVLEEENQPLVELSSSERPSISLRRSAASSSLSLRTLQTEEKNSSSAVYLVIFLVALGMGTILFILNQGGTSHVKDSTNPSSQKEKKLAHWESQLDDLEKRQKAEQALDPILFELKELEKPLKDTRLASRLARQIKAVKKKMALEKMEVLEKKVELLLRQKNYNQARAKIHDLRSLGGKYPALEKRLNRLENRVLHREKAKRKYDELHARAKEALQKEKIQEAINYYESYPSKYKDTPWYKLCDNHLENLYSRLNKKRAEEQKKEEARREYTKRKEAIRDLMAKKQFIRALGLIKKLPSQLEGTEWEKKLQNLKKEILTQRRRVVHRGEIPPPPRFSQISNDSPRNWKKTGSLAIEKRNGSLYFTNNSSREGTAVIGNSQWKDYILYFLVRLHKGKAEVILRGQGEKTQNFEATYLPFPSRLSQDKVWHECMILVRNESVSFFVTDFDLNQPQKNFATTTSHGKIGFLLHSSSEIQIKNLRIHVTGTQSNSSRKPPPGFDNLLAQGSLSQWTVSGPSQSWNWQGDFLQGQATNQQTILLSQKSYRHFILLLRIRPVQGKCNLVLQAQVQNGKIRSQVIPFSELATQGKWEQWVIRVKDGRAEIINRSQTVQKAFQIGGQGKIGFSLPSQSQVQISDVMIKEIP